MGSVIKIDGEMCLCNIGKNNYDVFRNAAEAIKNGYGEQAFTMYDDRLYFCNDRIEGISPYTDGVDRPLTELMSIAEKYSASLEGSFYITSDCSDFDDMTINVSGTKLSCENTEIANACDEELIAELEKRGYVVSRRD